MQAWLSKAGSHSESPKPHLVFPALSQPGPQLERTSLYPGSCQKDANRRQVSVLYAKQDGSQRKLQAVFMGNQEGRGKLQPGTEIKITVVQEVLPTGGLLTALSTTGPWGRGQGSKDTDCSPEQLWGAGSLLFDLRLFLSSHLAPGFLQTSEGFNRDTGLPAKHADHLVSSPCRSSGMTTKQCPGNFPRLES